MSPHDSDVLVCGVGALVLADETGGADDVESGDAEEAGWVVGACGLEDFGADGHRGVDGVGDDEDVGVGAGGRDGFGEVPDDGGVGVEEICVRGRDGRLAFGWNSRVMGKGVLEG